MGKVQKENSVIQSVLHHRQSPLDSICTAGMDQVYTILLGNWAKSRISVNQSVIHHRQNPLKFSVWGSYMSHPLEHAALHFKPFFIILYTAVSDVFNCQATFPLHLCGTRTTVAPIASPLRFGDRSSPRGFSTTDVTSLIKLYHF
jgi:hypothetical protein